MSAISNANHLPLRARLENLVGNKHCSDCSFVIEEDGNVEIPAHKVIVSLASPVLERILCGNDTFLPTDCITVEGISKDSFMQILHYIYTDTIHLDDDNVFEVLHKSHYFALPGIERECFAYLEENLNVSTVPWIYHQLFYAFPSSEVLTKCLQYIRIQPLTFFASEHFENISVDELKSILRMDAIDCTEVDLFGAVIKLARAHCTAAGLALTGANQRKVVDGAERLLRLESISESEFDDCLHMQSDFLSLDEIEKIRADIRNPGPTIVKRKWYTFADAVWIENSNDGVIPSSAFYSGRNCFIKRYFDKEDGPRVRSFSMSVERISRTLRGELLCGSGFEWRECANGLIPMGSVSISPKHMDPVFIAREPRGDSGILSALMNGNVMCRPNLQAAEEQYSRLSDCEILVASNVKNPYNEKKAPDDAIFMGCDESSLRTYLGRAWFRNDLLPAKVILEFGAFVSYDNVEAKADHFEFVRMDPGTYDWEEGTNGTVPENAILAGVTANGEDLYFGRVKLNGHYCPGKILRSHGVIYVPYRRHEMHFGSYEVLVHVKSDGVEATRHDFRIEMVTKL